MKSYTSRALNKYQDAKDEGYKRAVKDIMLQLNLVVNTRKNNRVFYVYKVGAKKLDGFIRAKGIIIR